MHLYDIIKRNTVTKHWQFVTPWSPDLEEKGESWKPLILHLAYEGYHPSVLSCAHHLSGDITA